ncbi:helix-turn-helix domain-containing protein [Aquibacillus albus]|uniref:Transcriptional regulator n=1 Tax=Aquibacillus albus TaxID=1168171 RepID=A0ABS2N675_9BACI|nr:helix-turn-helix transcriptional regulator [Aquibacillus albus]MBM7573641.1 putative transcriptional regulator [Aquibacillus albus]
MIRIRLKEVLEEKGYSQRGLARESGLRPAAINNLVNNKKEFVYLYHLDVIARVLDVDPRELIEYDPSKPYERPASSAELSKANKGNKNYVRNKSDA